MLANIIKLIRPNQWVKNVVVLAGVIFAGEAETITKVAVALQGMVAFCFLSSSVYVLNDIIDRNRDKLHPLKKNRPLATGEITPSVAAVVGLIMALVGVVLAFDINTSFLIVSFCFLGLNVLYSLILKNVVILDVMAIAAGFVLRAVAGALAINVGISVWLLLSTFVLALFLALGKRRHELTFLEKEASSHRQILDKYSPYLLDQLIGVVTASTVITYLFYALSPEVSAKLGTEYLFVTVPFVIYGIFRYLYLVHQEEKGWSPTQLLSTDFPLAMTVLLWLASVIIILYIL